MGEIDVTAADHDTDAQATDFDQAIHHGRSGQAAGGFDDHLHAFGKKSHLCAQLIVTDCDDVSDEPPHDGKSELANAGRLRTIGNGLRHGDTHDGARSQRLLRIIAGLRFDANDLAVGRKFGSRQRAAGDQSAAADTDKQDIEPADLIEQFFSDRTLTGNDVRVIKRRYQSGTTLSDDTLRNGLAIFAHSVVERDLGAITSGRRQLGRRCIAGHDNRRRHAQQLRCKRHGLRVIA